MELFQSLCQWDGKSKDDISAIFHEFSAKVGFEQQLLSLLEKPQSELGASWLLKAWCEHQGPLSMAQTEQIVGCMPGLACWQSKLHVLQIFHFLVLRAENEKIVLHFVRDCLQQQNKFVRAWAYHGYFYFAKHFESYQDEVMSCLNMALVDEPPSVKARVRQLVKQGFQ